MRRWELVAAGSAKFSEIGQSGVTVTVRFGRLGTAGQTKVKDLASEAAATTHVTKLITEKESKGYTETTAGTNVPTGQSAATSSAAATVPVPADSATPCHTADAAVPAGNTAADNQATDRTAADEDTLVFPARWRAGIRLRHGGRVPATVKPVRNAAGYVRAALFAERGLIEQILTAEGTEPALARSVTEYLDGTATPLGAAAAAMILKQLPGQDGTEPDRLVADDWVLTHGLPFAAQAAVALGRVQIEWHPKLGREARRLSFRAPDFVFGRTIATPTIDRVRQLVATTSEQDAIADAVAGHRETLLTRMIASYLVPSRTDWVDEVVTEATPPRTTHTWQGWSMVLCALGTVEQLEQVVASGHLAYELRNPGVLRTVVDGIGPAVAPVLADVFDGINHQYERDFGKQLLEVLAVLPTDEAFGILADRVHRPHVEATLIEVAKRYPGRALRAFAARSTEPTVRNLLHGHVRTHPDLVADLPDDLRQAVELAEADHQLVAEASPDSLPKVLVSPPWTVVRTVLKPVVVSGLEPPSDSAIAWQPGEREALLARLDARSADPNADWPKLVADQRSGSIRWYDEIMLFLQGPEDLIRPLLVDSGLRYEWDVDTWVPQLVGRFELDALSTVLDIAKSHPAAGPALLPYTDIRVAHLMADWLVRLKSGRATATTWLRRHADAAARYLVPTALGAPGAARRNAESALRHIPEQALAAARGYGPEAEAAVAALVSLDPLDILPAKLPVPGDWADPVMLPQILLADRQQALPPAAAGHVVTMLALSGPADVYPGLAIVQDLCDPTSLAEFAWALFERWKSVGMPSKDGFALTALGLLGNDDCARRLAPLIKVWPGEGGHNRAVIGLDVLAAIGSDVALVQLNGIALKAKFKGLKQRAQDKIAAVAADLGLSGEQLADRLVPDFGLDDAATLVIDYGPRRFVVGFDEQLKPYVADEDGKRRKDLPKPGAKDDPELAPAEQKRFAALKKDVRSVAADQIGRLESAMVKGRRWSAAEFRELFAGHPLLWHIVRRLVWITTDGHSFRLAEDRTLADVNDDAYTLPDNTEVSLAHPLNLGDDLAAWAEMFADYEILQPFPQLGRPLHRFTDDELTATRLDRFENIQVPVGRLLGLTKRGWERGAPQDAGVECWILRPLAAGGTVVVNLDPGIAVGVVDMFPEQKLTEIWVNDGRSGDWRPRGSRTFGELDPVTASELLAELTSLTS